MEYFKMKGATPGSGGDPSCNVWVHQAHCKRVSDPGGSFETIGHRTTTVSPFYDYIVINHFCCECYIWYHCYNVLESHFVQLCRTLYPNGATPMKDSGSKETGGDGCQSCGAFG